MSECWTWPRLSLIDGTGEFKADRVGHLENVPRAGTGGMFECGT